MKKFFLFATIFSFVSICYAEDSLFPELNFQEEEETSEIVSSAPMFAKIESSEIEPAQQEVVVQSEETVSENITQPESENLIPTTDENEEEDEEDEDDEDQKVFIALNNIKTTVAAVRNASYCSGEFVLFNGFKKKTLKEISVSLKIGNRDKKFDFKNVAPKGTTGKKFIMVGEDCASIIKVPAVDIQKCKISGVPDKKCKEKINFIPIPQNNV